MSNLILEKKWTKWYPENISFKNTKKIKKILCSSNNFKKEDFFIDKKNQKDLTFSKETSEINLTQKKAYETGFQKGLLKGKEENTLLKNKLNDLFLNFENSLAKFENELCSQLLKTVLKISSYVIGKKIDIDKQILLNYIKKIINKEGVFLKKPQFIIHPKNKTLIEDIFKKFLNSHKWTIVCDDGIDLNGCKIKSESVDIDATVDARWQQLCRLIYLEEY
ncbi:flagellar assembly protein FliH [Buchnera aphidicola]|uniref:Flagellar assembly protein FliH n=1 Tax=Buchnera aphidicola subsp. Acyrthosiphon pisum (strain 5A) TaxID=563178 RepID=A0A7U3YA10_BUCA5|nr:FliH/SctL family protein [Buchnera aphidicola]ACL30452.1 flagellar assembly protein FliH [Buchnera aphidicola str. 5A (Acyrthosiphon pisum)]